MEDQVLSSKMTVAISELWVVTQNSKFLKKELLPELMMRIKNLYLKVLRSEMDEAVLSFKTTKAISELCVIEQKCKF